MTSPEPPTPLTTRSSRVKEARKLARRASRTSARRFLAEGPQAVREALAYDGPGGPCVRDVFASCEAADRYPELRAAARGVDVAWHLVDEEALAALTDTVTPQGVVALCDFIDVPLADALTTSPNLVAICANVRDPGNAGTVIRCADAAAAPGEGVAGAQGCAVQAVA